MTNTPLDSDSISRDNTDLAWEMFADEDPYWAVLTQDRFRKKVLGETERHQFFLSGEQYVDWVFSMIRHHIDPQFNPGKGLDFGCGVGRLLLPIARRCQLAVGIDVSESMLKEAEANCQKEKVGNVSLIKSDDNFSTLAAQGHAAGFDLINSFIVLQHIPCDRGVVIFRRVLKLLNDGGVGAVHFTYSRADFPVNSGALNYDPRKRTIPTGVRDYLAGIKYFLQKLRTRYFYRTIPLSANKSELAPPVMQMNHYLLNSLFQVLQQAGVREIHVALSDHGGSLGAVLFFRKAQDKYLLPALEE